MNELCEILEKFASCGWEFDPLYKKALELLKQI